MTFCDVCMCMHWGRAEIDVHCCFSQFFHSLFFNLEHLNEPKALSFSYTNWPPKSGSTLLSLLSLSVCAKPSFEVRHLVFEFWASCLCKRHFTN